MNKSQVHFIDLVYPPISNQEAEWLSKDPQFCREVSSSKLYMIGQRKELRFCNYGLDTVTGSLMLDLVSEIHTISGIKVPLAPIVGGFFCEKFDLSMGPKMIRFQTKKDASSINSVLRWWTPDSFLYEYWRGKLQAEGLDQFRQLTGFDLFYVGISKREDSITRLFHRAHENRARILTNETQLSPTARLTDELMIFLFQIHPLTIAILDDHEDSIDDFISPEQHQKETLADAEKAFIRIMQTKYNRVKYTNYPGSVDGLFSTDIERWAYTINESIELRTNDATMSFFFSDDLHPSDFLKGDVIFSDGDTIELLQSTDGS